MASFWNRFSKAWTLISFYCVLQRFSECTSTCSSTRTAADGVCITTRSNNAMSWENAQSNCKADGGTLPVVDTFAKWRAFVNYRKTLANSGDPMWIGLKTENSVWKWENSGQPLDESVFSRWSSTVIDFGPEMTSVWVKTHPHKKYNANKPSIEEVHDVTSAIYCAIMCQTKLAECERFNYSLGSKRCLLLNGIPAIQETQSHADQEWDIWEIKT